MKTISLLCLLTMLVLGLSVADAGSTTIRVKSSPLGRRVRTSTHHRGNAKAATCAGVVKARGAGVAFGTVRLSACNCGPLCVGNCGCGCK